MSSIASLLSKGASEGWVLHHDTYACVAVNPDGKKYFDRVNRIKGKGQDKQVDLLLDIASEHFGLNKDEQFTLAVTSTLRLDGKPDEDAFNQDGKVRGAAACPARLPPPLPLFPSSFSARTFTPQPPPPPLFFAPQPSVLDSFNYGMCGRVFRVDSLERTEVSVIASFGGLLMQLKGEMKHLVRLKMDDRIYLLIKKI
jgi:DNA-directed RNA polymerase I, II, and III subunit RPABC3